jgi:microcystin-dependent protein
MRVRLQPELIATVRWYFAPPGALPLPNETAFGSSVWETPDRDYPQPGLGEIDLTRTWDQGVAPPGVTGQATPTPLAWYVDGVPATIAGPLAPCPGTLPAAPLWWWRPEEIQGLGVGGGITTWPPAPTTAIAGVLLPSDTAPDLVLGPSGRAAAHLHDPAFPDTVSQYFSLKPTCPVGSDGTLYLVGWTLAQAGHLNGPRVEGINPNTELIHMQNGFWELAMGGNAYAYPTNLQTDTVSVWRLIRTGGNQLGLDLATFYPFAWSPVQHFNGFSTAAGLVDSVKALAVTAGFSADSYIHEIIYWPRALGAPELAAVDNYLAAKYGSNLYVDYSDMMIGQLIIDAGGDAIPALFVPAYGQRLSQTVYSLLFGRFQFLYGPDLGDGTFAVLDLRGRVIYGSGFAYSTGQLVGNDSPTLTTDQIPAHTHSVSDPGHSHTPVIRNSFVTTGAAVVPNAVVTPSTANCALNTANTSRESNTTSDPTGLTVGNNTTLGLPVDVRQAGLALRPLIYAGQ